MSGKLWDSAIERVRTTARIAALDVKELAGIGEPTVYAQWRSVWDASGQLIQQRDQAPHRPVTLFFPVWGATGLLNKHIESVLAHSLYLRGHRVVVASCERALPACHVDPLGNRVMPVADEIAAGSVTSVTCAQCVWQLRRIFRESPLEYVGLSEHAQPDDLTRAMQLVQNQSFDALSRFQYQGIGVGAHAFASVCRVTGRGTLEDSPVHRRHLERHVVAAITLVDQTNRLLDELEPDRVVLTHGIYVDHGTISEVVRAKGIPLTVFVRPYRTNTVMLCHGDTYHRALITEPNSLWENRELTAEEQDRLTEYVESRRSGSMDNVTYHPSPVEGRERIAKMLSLDPDRPIVSLFTNVMWDAQIYHDYNAFANMLDWVYQTIEYFGRRPDIQLVIRVHPAEIKAVKKSLQPVAEEIRTHFPELPANVRVIGPESDISSYDLAEMSAATIVYGTKMGLEIALRGVPVIVAGESFIRGKGFTLDASSADEYFDILDRIPNIPRLSAAELTRARRYGYHFYFRRQIDFPFVTEPFKNNTKGIRLGFSDLRALMPGANRYLDSICAGLTSGEEIVVE